MAQGSHMVTLFEELTGCESKPIPLTTLTHLSPKGGGWGDVTRAWYSQQSENKALPGQLSPTETHQLALGPVLSIGTFPPKGQGHLASFNQKSTHWSAFEGPKTYTESFRLDYFQLSAVGCGLLPQDLASVIEIRVDKDSVQEKEAILMCPSGFAGETT